MTTPTKTTPPTLTVCETDLDAIKDFEGRIAVFVPETGQLDNLARRVNRLMRGALQRFVESPSFAKLKTGEGHVLAWPSGLVAEAVHVICQPRRVTPVEARAAGGAVAKAAGGKPLLILAGNMPRATDMALGCLLRSYSFDACKGAAAKNDAADAADTANGAEDASRDGSITLMTNKAEDFAPQIAELNAIAESVYFTRDLVNLPANILTTTEFAAQLEALTDLGLKVEVLEEDQMHELGMEMMLAVGYGSDTPTKVVVMEWQGGGDEPPLALIGKGVVFDTGGISMKPAGGMEDMTMDMGGAGVVSGVMKLVASRKAKANVVGLVGLVENMPDGRAQRPGDIVTSMKGDTVEVINTDAEGRLVLGDVMWYAAERFKPSAMVDLATLTGAIIVALGHENAGVFSNDDAFCNGFLKAAEAEGEGAWRMPLGAPYAKLLKSQKADVKNVGSRAAGSVTAAEFLQRFVPEGLPWIHLDIAGVAQPVGETAVAPKGASGWGVMALDRLIRNRFELADAVSAAPGSTEG